MCVWLFSRVIGDIRIAQHGYINNYKVFFSPGAITDHIKLWPHLAFSPAKHFPAKVQNMKESILVHWNTTRYSGNWYQYASANCPINEEYGPKPNSEALCPLPPSEITLDDPRSLFWLPLPLPSSPPLTMFCPLYPLYLFFAPVSFHLQIWKNYLWVNVA